MCLPTLGNHMGLPLPTGNRDCMKRKEPVLKPYIQEEEKLRRKKQKEALAKERRPGQLPAEILQSNAQLNQPVDQQMLLQMQQEHGNSYVQSFLTRLGQKQQHDEREEEDERKRAPQSSGKLAEHNAYEMETEATISDRGVMRMDISQMLDVKRYSKLVRQYRHAIQMWKGSAAVDLAGEPFQDNEVGVQTDGLLRLQLGNNFLRSLETVQDEKLQNQQPEMGYGLPFKARIKATLHYRSQDPQLREAGVDKTKRQSMQQSQDQRGLYLKLQVQSVYHYRVGDKREEKELLADIVLAAEVRG
jgi:hypothetical protein